MQEWANDFYGESGCCKTCDPDWKAGNSREVDGICLCYECKCRQCYWYGRTDFRRGRCEYP